VAGFCDSSNEPTGSIKCRDFFFFGKLKYCGLSKRTLLPGVSYNFRRWLISVLQLLNICYVCFCILLVVSLLERIDLLSPVNSRTIIEELFTCKSRSTKIVIEV